LGNLEGFVYWDFLIEKENAYLGSFFLDPEDIKSEVWGPSGTFAKEQGSIELISGYGAQRARWDRKGWNPNANQSVNISAQLSFHWSPCGRCL
jgi:hypothetical protein